MNPKVAVTVALDFEVAEKFDRLAKEHFTNKNKLLKLLISDFINKCEDEINYYDDLLEDLT